jgi:transcriptional regulator with PAS, ATPase and Fis domain
VPAPVTVAITRCLEELPRLVRNGGRPDALIINLASDTTEEHVLGFLKRLRYDGPLFAILESGGMEPSGDLVKHPGVRCVRVGSCALIEQLLRAAVPRVAAAGVATHRSAPPTYHGIVGASPRMTEIFQRIDKVATGDANVCIYGESGTGKELIARAIHYASPRRDRPLVTLDCTTIPEGLMESHLLGHTKGAFTGAIDHHEGVFSLAHTGTLFIDELAELSPTLQAKLLRVIQSREFVPVGGTRPVRTDVRIVTATNRDLKREVEKGNLREDLYYRVAVFMIKVPPLRERIGDVPLLVDYFIERFSRRYAKRVRGVEPAALARLAALPWPGNVRQLENFLEQAVVLAEGDILTERDLFTGEPPLTAPALGSDDAGDEPMSLHEVERRHILHTLQRVDGNRREAARLLGISLRCLQYRLKEYSRIGRRPAASAS